MRLFTNVIRTVCETVLSWLPPDESMLGERPARVDWDPAVARMCEHCPWVWLIYQPDVWYCPNCSWLAISVFNPPSPTTDPLADALEVTESRQKAIAAPVDSRAVVVSHATGKLATGDFVRRFHRKFKAGEVSFHGIELQWEDTGELPAIGSWSYPDIR